jgi:pilus assembly protein Flp/PilA
MFIIADPLARPRRREAGQGLVEYALILVLVALVVIVILSVLGTAIQEPYNQILCTFQAGSSRWQGYDVAMSFTPPLDYYGCLASGQFLDQLTQNDPDTFIEGMRFLTSTRQRG